MLSVLGLMNYLAGSSKKGKEEANVGPERTLVLLKPDGVHRQGRVVFI